MLYQLGQWLIRRTETRLHRAIFVVGMAILAASCEAVFHSWLNNHVAREWRLALDAASIGVLVGVITYIEIIAVQVRRARVAAEMKAIAELNHSVRNALQGISYAVRMPEAQGQVQIIEDCVRRIDKTMRDLFPAIPDRSKATAKTSSGPSN